MVVVTHRVVKHLALVLVQLDTSAHALRAPAVLAVVGKQARVQLGVAGAAHRAGAPARERVQLANACGGLAGQHRGLQTAQIAQHMQHALAVGERGGQRLAQLRLVLGLHRQAEHRQLDGVFLEAVDAREAGGRQKVAVHPQMGEATWPRPVGQLGVDALAVHHQRREQADVLAAKGFEQLGGNAVGGLRRHRRAVVHAMLGAELDVQQAQEMPDLGGGADRGLAPAARQALLDGHRGRNAIHRVHLGPSGRLHDAARIGVERLQVTALTLVEQDVKSQRRLARTRHAGDDAELAARNVHAERLEVVLTRVHDLDAVQPARALGHRQRLAHKGIGQRALAHRMHGPHGLRVLAQRLAGVRASMRHQVGRRAASHQFTASVTALGAEVDQPVAGADHVQVVLDHQQRMAGIEQLAQCAHQLGDVIKVQAGGGLIKHEQAAPPRRRLPAGAAGFGGLGQKAGELESLRLTARQRGHRLPQLHVLQPDIHNGLQRADHIGIFGKQGCGFAHRQVQHIGHVQQPEIGI